MKEYENKRKTTVSHVVYECMGRIPYATFITFIMSIVGALTFYFSAKKGIHYTIGMVKTSFDDKMKQNHNADADRVDYGAGIVLLVLLLVMVVWGIVILIFAFFATGATRESIYKGWAARLSGKIWCIVLLVVTYILTLIWVALFGIMCCFIFVHSALAISACAIAPKPKPDLERCIDFSNMQSLIDFFLDFSPTQDWTICDDEVNTYCKEYFEPAETMYIIATVASCVMVLSMFQYMMCLSANFSHIKDVKNSASKKVSPADSDSSVMISADASTAAYNHYRRGGPLTQNEK